MYNVKKISGRKGISLFAVWVSSLLYSYVISWSYGNSYSVYVGMSLLGMAVGYYNYLAYVRKRCEGVWALVLILNFITITMSIVNENLIGSFQVNISIVSMFAIAKLNINYRKLNKQLVAMAAVSLAAAYYFTPVMISNSNSKGFLLYICAGTGFLCFILANKLFKRVLSAVYIVVVVSLALATESRNTGVVMLLCSILLVIPERIYRKPGFYRTLYVIAMTATIFAPSIMRFVFSNDTIMTHLLRITSSFSKKAWGMDGHLEMILFVQERFTQLNFLEKVFGVGVKLYHCHNLFYQCLFFYGYVGTAIVYGICAYIFETGFKMFRYNGNRLALGCCMIMLGHFLMQIGEVYMFGSETLLLGALVPMGIIMNQYKINNKSAVQMPNV